MKGLSKHCLFLCMFVFVNQGVPVYCSATPEMYLQLKPSLFDGHCAPPDDVSFHVHRLDVLEREKAPCLVRVIQRMHKKERLNDEGTPTTVHTVPCLLSSLLGQ